MSQLFVISAPSGAGKTSLVKALIGSRPNLEVSVSHTTRKPREQEVDGRDYFFVSTERFQELIEQGAFLEHARVFDNFYGTSRAQVEQKFAAGKDVLLEIDWQGAQQVRRAMPGVRSIFILPPSRAVLEQRLRERRTDSAATIARRLADAATDMAHYREFDYVVVNDDFARARAEVGSILDGAGTDLHPSRSDLQPLIQSLLAG